MQYNNYLLVNDLSSGNGFPGNTNLLGNWPASSLFCWVWRIKDFLYVKEHDHKPLLCNMYPPGEHYESHET